MRDEVVPRAELLGESLPADVAAERRVGGLGSGGVGEAGADAAAAALAVQGDLVCLVVGGDPGFVLVQTNKVFMLSTCKNYLCPYFVMRHPVVVQVARGSEPLAANAALVWLLSAVDPPWEIMERKG